MGNKGRVGYSSDVSDEECAFVVPYLLPCREDAPQREYSLRAVFNGLRVPGTDGLPVAVFAARSASMAGGLPADAALDRVALLETMVEDLRLLLREFTGRKAQPTAMLLDSRTIQSTSESWARAGYGGAKRRKGFEGCMRQSTR
jgi:hypothetical protein